MGAGDAVTANLAAALAAGASPREAMELAMAAASLVIHQLGTTGTASIRRSHPSFHVRPTKPCSPAAFKPLGWSRIPGSFAHDPARGPLAR